MSTLTQKELKKIVSYNPDTGNFRWKINKRSGAKISNIAGCKVSIGYIGFKVGSKLYPAHRLAFLSYKYVKNSFKFGEK